MDRIPQGDLILPGVPGIDDDFRDAAERVDRTAVPFHLSIPCTLVGDLHDVRPGPVNGDSQDRAGLDGMAAGLTRIGFSKPNERSLILGESGGQT